MNYVEELFSVKDRRVVVTGATSGIGFMIAEGFVKAGAVTTLVSRKAAALEEVVSELSQHGRCDYIAADVSTQDGCLAVAEALKERTDAVHILVNAAGCTWGAPIRQYPDKAWDKVLDLNVRGVFNLTVACMDLLLAASTPEHLARVINVGSVHGNAAPEWESYAYSASKAAVHHLTVHLAKRLGRDGILVNAIAPGPFPSKMMDALLEVEGDKLRGETATGRLGEPNDMAGVALYLASRASNNVTGAIIPVDGGYVTTR